MARRHVLVIEDDASNSLLIEVTLRQVDCETITRSNGIAGLDSARGGGIDLIILDIALPGMSGWDVLAMIRDDPLTLHIPVLVLTAHAGEESMLRAYGLGADGFMSKPFFPDDLRSSARTLLGIGPGVESPSR